MKNFKEKFNKFMDILFPPDIICIYCGEEIKHANKYHACDNCLQNLPYLKGKICKHCGTKLHSDSEICFLCYNQLPPFQIARSTFIYEMPIVSLVHKIKYGNARYLFKPLANFMTETYKQYTFDCDVIVPVPLSKERLKTRHYNQAEELAKVLGANLGLPIESNCIEKIKHTEKQSSLGYFDRIANIKNAYRLKDKKPLAGKRILLVDDVITTGETIKNVCKELWRAKPVSISVLSLAHTDFAKKPKATFIYKIKKLTLAKIQREIAFSKNKAKIRMKIKEFKDEEKKDK